MAKPKNPKKPNGDAAASTVEPNVPAIESSAVESKPTKPARRPTIVKADPRATVVPINLDEEIRRLAYLMAERRGFEPGHESDDWLAAEQEVRQRYHQQSA